MMYIYLGSKENTVENGVFLLHFYSDVCAHRYAADPLVTRSNLHEIFENMYMFSRMYGLRCWQNLEIIK